MRNKAKTVSAKELSVDELCEYAHYLFPAPGREITSFWIAGMVACGADNGIISMGLVRMANAIRFLGGEASFESLESHCVDIEHLIEATQTDEADTLH